MIKPHLHNGAAFAGLTIGLLGGSFNPAHRGHLAMSLHALRQLGLDQVWWLVSPQNPLKDKDSLAGFAQRVERAQQMAMHPRIIVTDLEARLGTTYTADTLQVLKKRFPHTRFIWLMGADNLEQIPQWKNWETIFHLVPVAVFRRPGYAAGRGLGKAAIRFCRAWRDPALERVSVNTPLPAWVILDNKLNTLSATKIRKDDPSWQI